MENSAGAADPVARTRIDTDTGPNRLARRGLLNRPRLRNHPPALSGVPPTSKECGAWQS